MTETTKAATENQVVRRKRTSILLANTKMRAATAIQSD